MRCLPLVLVALLTAAPLAAPAQAQILGARPGYADATHKVERQRQQLQAQIREAQRQRAAQAAMQAEANKNK